MMDALPGKAFAISDKELHPQMATIRPRPRPLPRASLGRRRPHDYGSPENNPATLARFRYSGREFPSWLANSVQSRLRETPTTEQGPRILLHLRIWTDRSLPRPTRLRYRRVRDERDHEHHWRGRSSIRQSKYSCCRHRSRSLRINGNSRMSLPATSDWKRRVHRHLTLRLDRFLA